jgi:hypothetical protein
VLELPGPPGLDHIGLLANRQLGHLVYLFARRGRPDRPNG